MVLLLTGLPWADIWGSAFKAVRAELGWVKSAQDWTIGGRAADANEHAEHNHAAMMAGQGAMPTVSHVMPDGSVMTMAMTPVSLSQIVAEAKSQHLPFPVIVTSPAMPKESAASASSVWSVKSETQNRPKRVSLTYDPVTGKELSRETFTDKHVIDQVIGYGVAWHEGQLFGPINQLVGVMTALMLVTISVSGFVMWRKRKPEALLGAPSAPASRKKLRGLAFLTLSIAAFLPLICMLIVLILSRFIEKNKKVAEMRKEQA